MEVYYIVVLFILGIVMGSFYNVVGYRLPKGESLIRPSSHCPNCNHKLKGYELIPIFSFLFLGGKCLKCKQKISWFYPIFEFVTGCLFALSYLVFGMSFDLLLSITLVSMLLIVIISDYHYLIIPDEVLVVSLILLSIEIIVIRGFNGLINAYFSGIICFGFMYVLKLFGDFTFKKESMGGGDIKLMFIIGMILGWQLGIVSVFVSAFIALPVSVIILLIKKDHVLPFGPFLSVATLLLFLLKIDFNSILTLF